MNLHPYVITCRAGILINRPYDGDVRLVIEIQPVDKQPDDIVRAELCACCIRYEIGDRPSLFFRVGFVPRPKGPPDKIEVILALNPFNNLVPDPFKTSGDVVEGSGQKPHLSLMLVEPLCSHVIGLDVARLSLEACHRADEPTNPRDAAKCSKQELFEHALARCWRNLGKLGPDGFNFAVITRHALAGAIGRHSISAQHVIEQFYAL